MTPGDRAGHLAHALTPLFASKVAAAQQIVSEVLSQSQRPYIAFSTGKDSTVTAALVWEQAPEVPAVYMDADCAFPESVELLERMARAGHTVIKWPCEPFLDILERAGGPDAPGVEDATMRATVWGPVKALLAASAYDGSFVGLRAEESRDRRRLIQIRGPVFRQAQYGGILEGLPVAWWTDRDVWAFIVSRGLDYNRAYDRMEQLPFRQRRISYWAGETSRRYGRWVWLRREYPALWNRFSSRFPEVSRFT